jgi:hypothetical protein
MGKRKPGADPAMHSPTTSVPNVLGDGWSLFVQQDILFMVKTTTVNFRHYLVHARERSSCRPE